MRTEYLEDTSFPSWIFQCNHGLFHSFYRNYDSLKGTVSSTLVWGVLFKKKIQQKAYECKRGSKIKQE